MFLIYWAIYTYIELRKLISSVSFYLFKTATGKFKITYVALIIYLLDDAVLNHLLLVYDRMLKIHLE